MTLVHQKRLIRGILTAARIEIHDTKHKTTLEDNTRDDDI
jgi:hypothetical protein